jgi:Fe-S cluster assembly iron-binding protein IscA
MVEYDGVTFLVAPEMYNLTGEVTISYVDEAGRRGFLLTSDKPTGEWDGFAASKIDI